MSLSVQPLTNDHRNGGSTISRSRCSFSFSFSSSRLFFAVLLVLSVLDPNSVVTKAETRNGDIYNKIPNLPFGDINVVVLTDVHSWVRILLCTAVLL